MHAHSHKKSLVHLKSITPEDECSADVAQFANQALVQWTTNIADRIKNPIAGMSAALDIIEKQFNVYRQTSSMDEALMSRAINLTKARLDVLNQYVSDVVNIAQPAKIESRIVDPASLINQVVEDSLAKSEWTGHISVSIDPDVKWLLCDPDKIKIMLNALIENSVEAVKPSQEPDLAITVHFVIDDDNKKSVAISVCDNGHGIDLEMLQRVRMPFFTTKEARAGLGFALVEKIAAAHGGKVTIHQCEELKGAQVSVLLPIEASQPTLKHLSNSGTKNE